MLARRATRSVLLFSPWKANLLRAGDPHRRRRLDHRVPFGHDLGRHRPPWDSEWLGEREDRPGAPWESMELHSWVRAATPIALTAVFGEFMRPDRPQAHPLCIKSGRSSALLAALSALRRLSAPHSLLRRAWPSPMR